MSFVKYVRKDLVEIVIVVMITGIRNVMIWIVRSLCVMSMILNVVQKNGMRVVLILLMSFVKYVKEVGLVQQVIVVNLMKYQNVII